ncbi:MAG: tol-pal system protein YbgF [Rhodopseudomonas sp.]|nr:tol-pal system protein YbgF [Rhodopseudomonas sp.]
MGATWAAPARAQERSGNFLDNLFNRGDSPQADQGGGQQGGPPVGQGAGGDPNDPGVRFDRIENALRQLTGKVEELQHRNQQLEMQMQRLQGGGGQPGAAPPPNGAPNLAPAMTPMAPSPATGRRGDAFDPSQHPNAPGAPRTLGNTAIVAPEPNTPIGAPNGRAAGAPLDLSTMSGNPPPQVPAAGVPAAPVTNTEPVRAAAVPPPARPMQPPIQNVGAPPARLATLPPSARPQDEYDLAYGYILHKDYALAEQAFRDFMRKYPNETLVPDAQYWLGESLYQRQRYRDAAEAFLVISTKFEHTGKAPSALLRLGQSLAALKQKEAACATLAEVGRKYPKASSSVKRGVAQELKRAHC